MAKNNGASASKMIQKIEADLSTTERRTRDVIERGVSRRWRNFWISAAHRRGYSNTEIAKEFEISEGTVRNVLTQQD